MNRLTLQTRAIAPLLRTPFLGRLSCDLPGKSLVHLASTSTCVACSKSWSRRYKKSTCTVIIMKTPVSLCSTLGKSELVCMRRHHFHLSVKVSQTREGCLYYLSQLQKSMQCLLITLFMPGKRGGGGGGGGWQDSQ